VEVEVVQKSTGVLAHSIFHTTSALNTCRTRRRVRGMRGSILAKAHYIPAGLLLLYPVLLFLLTIPWLQKQYVHLSLREWLYIKC
jgi:hypothetical protein